MTRALGVVLLAAVCLALAGLADVRAQSAVDVHASNAAVEFPRGLTFTLDASVNGTLGDVRLVYEIAPDGVRATAVPQCTGAAALSCRFQLVSGQRALLIPGADVTYFWRIAAGGATQETPPQKVTYQDTRFDWHTVNDGNLTLWYYRGSDAEARAVLDAGRQSLDRISALLQTAVDFPVKIYYYASAQEMQAAIVASNAPGVVTLGEVVYSDTAMVSADAAPEDIARHEVAHIVVRQAVRGPSSVPDWLNEGTAVFAQSHLLSDQQQALDDAIRSGDVFSVRSISSASAGALSSRVSLFYGQSWSLVTFLVDTYGEQKFADLFRAFKSGTNTGDALQQVYGFNQDGLENAWRASVGLPPRQAPTPNEGTASQPTAPSAGANAGVSDNGGGASTAVIVVIALLTVVLAGGLVGLGLLLARRYR